MDLAAAAGRWRTTVARPRPPMRGNGARRPLPIDTEAAVTGKVVVSHPETP
jgi:hypothetical protein